MAPHFFLPQALEVFPTLTLREPPPLSPFINLAITSSLRSSQILGPFPSVLWPFSLFTLSVLSVLMSWLSFLSLSLPSSSPLCFFPSFSSLSILPLSLTSVLSFGFLFICLKQSLSISFQLALNLPQLPS